MTSLRSPAFTNHDSPICPEPSGSGSSVNEATIDLEVHFHTQVGKVLGSPFKFRKHGGSGMELSELLPHTAKISDDITLVRSMVTDSVDHEAALRVMKNHEETLRKLADS